VEGLEHEADLLAAHPCLLGLGQDGDVVAVQFVAPAVGPVEQADDVEQGGLAGTRRPMIDTYSPDAMSRGDAV